MFGLGKKARKEQADALRGSLSWQQRYLDEKAAHEKHILDIQDAHREIVALHSAAADRILWIERICTLIPQLRLRSDREQPVIKTQLGLLLAEAREKGWIVIEKKGKPMDTGGGE